MRIVLEEKNKIKSMILPKEISGNFWITDIEGKNLINIEAENSSWVLKSNTEVKITNNIEDKSLSNINNLESSLLEEGNYYYITNTMTKSDYILYCLKTPENFCNLVVDFNRVNKFEVGNKNKGNEVTVSNPLIQDKQLCFEYDKKGVLVKNLNDKNKLFVNDIQVNQIYLASGDIIFVGGLFIYYFGSLILFANDKNDLVFDSVKLSKRLIKPNEVKDYSNEVDKDVKVFDKSQYFQRPPRFKRGIEHKVFNIDPPTQKETQEEMPLIFTIAPMLTMAMTSMVTGFTSLQKILQGTSTFKDEMSSLLVCGSMLLSMIFFPLLQKFYTKMKRLQKERKRRKKYKKYIDERREEIFKEINYQKQVLIEDNLPFGNVANTILTKSRNLWERKIEHIDFLDLRLGIGTKKPDIEIKYPEEHFTMEEDNLKDIITDLIKESKDITDVPITLNFRTNKNVGIIGEQGIVNAFIDNLMLQIMAYHGYDMLRIVVLTNEKNKNYWEKFRNLPYFWNNDKSVRYFATNKEDINKVTSYLKEEYNYRLENTKENENILYTPYYLIFTDDANFVKNNFFISEILKNNMNLGYSVVISSEKLDDLPNECNMFINVNPNSSGVFTNEMNAENQATFVPDLVNFSLRNCITTVSNIPIDIANGKFILPTKYGFLEMYDVGNVNQLNILNRWKNNDVVNSLEAPVGIDEQGELFNIDLHEKAHGPHGLVAGMTGSGKSEWIITYILSMAVNYSPEEVQFVLIDYKGGGLALTFDNRENNIKLPHVVGTITNLDVVEIKRSLASIESELKRRQAMFKSAREELNESSMDIYKYQDYYRQGKLREPMSHLFIISDEFAELKSQQPEFMAQLISTARIGRSLGVHLILATQKPSGVVDDQIWSNSKFKVCLKVQDKSDSNDMLKCPDAAMLKETGRFYFQVGFNEFFAKGQSAYAGVPYYESDKKITVVDSSIDFVNDIGSMIKRVDIKKNNNQYVHKGEELPNILNYIIETEQKENMNIRQLWLTSIPSTIYVDKLIEKYNWKKEDYILNPVIGEYDYPSKQEQGLLTLPLSESGNTIIYGSSGSGKENLVTTILYSLIIQYTPKEINCYILDFGSSVLNNFKLAPHIGDIINSGENDKINNLFDMISKEIISRKKLFESFGGTYINYINNSKKTLPNILVIINSYEVFNDLYEQYYDKVIELSRDCTRYGIYFILTVQAANNVKLKLSQNFKNALCLQMTDAYDYTSVLGKTNGIVPSKFLGRGLVKLESIVEFQTAYALKSDNLYESIKQKCIELNISSSLYANRVKVLPEIVEYEDLVNQKNALKGIPIGITKKTLEIAQIKIEDYLGYIISANNLNNITIFIDNFLNILNNMSNYYTVVFDLKYLYQNNENNYNNIYYYNNNYSAALKNLVGGFSNIYKELEKNNFRRQVVSNLKTYVLVVIGVDKFIRGLSEENKQYFNNLITYIKECFKLKIIFIDSYNEIKKLDYESWYKDIFENTNGLWIGDGFADQNLIKPYKFSSEHSLSIGNNFGYLLEDGQANLVKLVQKK